MFKIFTSLEDYFNNEFLPRKKQIISDTTLGNYIRVFNNFKVLNNKKIFWIKENDILSELSLIKDSYKPEVLKLLNVFFKFALSKKDILLNPCQNIKIKQPKRVGEYFTKNEIELLLEKSNNNKRLHIAILLGFYGGLRRGEICGLQFKFVDFKENTIDIRQQIVRPYKDIPRVSQLKTQSSIGKIKMSLAIMEKLKEFKGNEYVVPGINSKFLDPSWITVNFRNLRREVGIDDSKRFHDLRVSMVTHLVAAGVDVKTVSKRARHANESITLGIYAQYMQSNEEKCVDVLDDLFKA